MEQWEIRRKKKRLIFGRTYRNNGLVISHDKDRVLFPCYCPRRRSYWQHAVVACFVGRQHNQMMISGDVFLWSTHKNNMSTIRRVRFYNVLTTWDLELDSLYSWSMWMEGENDWIMRVKTKCASRRRSRRNQGYQHVNVNIKKKHTETAVGYRLERWVICKLERLSLDFVTFVPEEAAEAHRWGECLFDARTTDAAFIPVGFGCGCVYGSVCGCGCGCGGLGVAAPATLSRRDCAIHTCDLSPGEKRDNVDVYVRFYVAPKRIHNTLKHLRQTHSTFFYNPHQNAYNERPLHPFTLLDNTLQLLMQTLSLYYTEGKLVEILMETRTIIL